MAKWKIADVVRAAFWDVSRYGTSLLHRRSCQSHQQDTLETARCCPRWRSFPTLTVLPAAITYVTQNPPSVVMAYPDAAAFGNLTVLTSLIDALDRFNQFEGPDPAGRRRSRWTEQLGTALPEEGAGLESVLDLSLIHI